MRTHALLLAVLFLPPWTAAAQPLHPLNPPLLDNVEAAFAHIDTRGTHVTACANGMIPRPLYRTSSLSNFFGVRNHFQGIQRLPQPGYLVISGSNNQGSDLFVVRLSPTADGDGCQLGGKIVARIRVDDVMDHAGGLAMLGTILAVPIHGGSPLNAKVVFYDFADPESPRRLAMEIARPGRKASSTALTRLPNGHFLVAVLSAFDGAPRRVDFYLSKTTGFDDGFLSEPVMWQPKDVEARSEQEPTFSYFQNVSFVRQADGRLYLIGFHNSFAPQTLLPGRDYADLYEIVLPDSVMENANPVLARPNVVKAANRMLHCASGFCSFGAAAGLYIDPVSGSMTVYAAPGWLDGDTVKVTTFSSRSASDTARTILSPPR